MTLTNMQTELITVSNQFNSYLRASESCQLWRRHLVLDTCWTGALFCGAFTAVCDAPNVLSTHAFTWKLLTPSFQVVIAKAVFCDIQKCQIPSSKVWQITKIARPVAYDTFATMLVCHWNDVCMYRCTT